MNRNLFLLVFTALVFVFFVTDVHGQSFVPYTISDVTSEVNIYTDPAKPKPGQDFTISLESFAIDLKASNISFYVNGKLIQSEDGVPYAVIPNTTRVSNIKIVIKTPDGRVVEKEKTIVPSLVSLIWSAKTYTPPFYAGKALPNIQSQIVVTAVPELTSPSGAKIPNKNIVYTWKVNTSTWSEVSGLGRNTLVIDQFYIKNSIFINVTAESKDKASIASESITIPYTSPRVSFYETDPLYGTNWNKSLQKLTTNESEIGLTAIPFYFTALASDQSSLSYEWKINNKKSNEKTSSILLRNANDESGKSTIGVIINNTKSAFQKLQKELVIELTK